MIKIVNDKGFPEFLVNSLSADYYKKRGYISTTSIIDSPRKRILSEIVGRSKNIILSENVSSKMYSVLGSAVHSFLERGSIGLRSKSLVDRLSVLRESYRYIMLSHKNYAGAAEVLGRIKEEAEMIKKNIWSADDDRYIMEKSMSIDILGRELTGTFDLFDKKTKIISDYKITGVYSVMKKDTSGWINQQNIYKYMATKKYGMRVDGAQIVAILRDYSAFRSKFEKNYPESPIEIVNIPLSDNNDIEKYLERRMSLHVEAEEAFLSGKPIPYCTDEEIWSNGVTWAVKKPGNKNSKLFSKDKIDEALKYADSVGAKIEKRLGEPKRCTGYCPAFVICEQAKKMGVNKSKTFNIIEKRDANEYF